MQKQKVVHPDRIMSYFLANIPVLIIVTISGLIYNIGMLAGPYFEGRLAQTLYDIIGGRSKFSDMVQIAFFYIIAILIVQAGRAVKRFGVRRFANNVSSSMRRNLYNSLVHSDQQKLQKEGLGSLLTKAISDVDACSEGMRKFTTEIFDTGVVMIAYVCMLVHYDFRLAILSCMFTPIAYLAADRLKTVVTRANAEYKKSAAALSGRTMDRIGNALTYRVYGREKNRDEAYERSLSDYEKKSAKANLFESSMAPLYDAIAMLGTVLVIYFGAKNVQGTGWTAWNIAAFTTFLSCFTKLATKVSHAAKLFNSVQKAAVSWKRIKPLMKDSVEDSFDPDKVPVRPQGVEFSDVTCGYDGEKMLKHISFEAKPGQIIGVTGGVASGKSLLGRVLLGEVPYEGAVTIGGKDLGSMTEREKLEAVSYSGHDPELLSTSFFDNISLGSDIDVDRFLQMTCLDEDLKNMHRSADWPVGEGGAMLSGGQQARLSLARALAHARSILVLDDPFASVDKVTETKILKEIRREFPDRTIIIMTHRLYHFPEFDCVLYLHNGHGTFLPHDKMLEKEPGYRALYEEQAKGGDYDDI
ncbi:MAG: ABC transporter ATP-binding protein [Lachnospiraceae bacterium]|uniref:ABC transporter ATP-binding protein n=1 Tax=Candidatus Weimeria bifida TaxID=2599074 RepID=A0A6N7IYL4_9FIRM|nr:ABC transporter ATP-binding protein [Candidatus Weimeria bifida]RRF97279.1 MAG: ABC transporter ATP-binding protein [Lachnospiraceae bacterium]